MKDQLGDRMKAYETAFTKHKLPKHGIFVVRVDGAAFHTYTKQRSSATGNQLFGKPFCPAMLIGMSAVAEQLRLLLPNVLATYHRSDECTVVYHTLYKDSQNVFGGSLSKLNSRCAARATAAFNRAVDLATEYEVPRPAEFDCRVFTVPNLAEAANNLVWRIKDAQRNAISMIAEHEFTSKQLQNKTTAERIKMIEQRYNKPIHEMYWHKFLNGCLNTKFKILPVQPEQLNFGSIYEQMRGLVERNRVSDKLLATQVDYVPNKPSKEATTNG